MARFIARDVGACFSAAMTLVPGFESDTCEIKSAIGAGGRGKAYRAVDKKLGRPHRLAQTRGKPERRRRERSPAATPRTAYAAGREAPRRGDLSRECSKPSWYRVNRPEVSGIPSRIKEVAYARLLSEHGRIPANDHESTIIALRRLPSAEGGQTPANASMYPDGGLPTS